MKASDFEAFAEYYDRLYLKRGKNYEKEVEVLDGIIMQMEPRRPKTLLDVGCGTGSHLKYFSKNLDCTGVDISKRMVRIARKKVPGAKFEVANMVSLRLKNRFDVITCLFSAIGYVQSFNNLVKTLENFHEHLSDNVIVEPWVFKKDFRTGRVSLDTVEDEEVKFVRMATNKVGESEWLVFMHYLVGKKGQIRYVRESHKMASLDCEDYLKAFELAQFKDIKYLTDNLWDDCRGLFVARK